MNEKFRRIFASVLLILPSFVVYVNNLNDDYTKINLLWGALVTIILMAFLYLPLDKKIERFSVAWGMGICIGTGLFVIGLVISDSESQPDVYRAWAQYMWMFGIILTALSLSMPKEHKPYKWSFFKRVRPVEDEENVGS